MKLATLRDGSRDGRLVVVSRDLKRAVLAPPLVRTLQTALDHWDRVLPWLQELSDRLNDGGADGAFPFDETAVESPLPRAYQWADGSAYVNHVELVRKARGATLPDSFWVDPLLYQGGSDGFLAPRAGIPLYDDAWGLDFEAEIAVIVGDVQLGASASTARDSIRLLTLVNDVSLRGLIPAELAKGFGFFQSKPASAFSPVAVTPDEVGAAWDGDKVARPLLSFLNETPFGKPNAGIDMTFTFPELIAHAARTRTLGAGAIIGSGTVSNKQSTAFGSAIQDGGVGYSCLAEIRMIETLNSGAPTTPFLRVGDRIRIEMRDVAGASIFGAIDQQVIAAG